MAALALDIHVRESLWQWGPSGISDYHVKYKLVISRLVSHHLIQNHETNGSDNMITNTIQYKCTICVCSEVKFNPREGI
jgi:hypothetical protein